MRASRIVPVALLFGGFLTASAAAGEPAVKVTPPGVSKVEPELAPDPRVTAVLQKLE